MHVNNMLRLVCCIFVLLSYHSISSGAEQNRQLNFIWNSLFTFTKPQESVKTDKICVGCASKLYDDREWEKEITALRIEYIKNQILKKLRLKEKPSVALPIAGLPKPVTEDENLFPRSQEDSASEYSDDYYGKTTQAIIFPHEGTTRSFP